MKFYTNVELIKNKIYSRGYENGIQFFESSQSYNPKLYVTTKNESEFKTLDGTNLEPIHTGNIKESRDYIERYSDVDNFNIYGMENFLQNYIEEKYPNNIEYDFKLLRTFYLDIETECEDGFPNVKEADQPITIFNIFYRGKYYFFYLKKWGEFKCDRSDTKVLGFNTEEKMLEAILKFWEKIRPDVITGWNSEGFDIVYTINRIKRLLSWKDACRLSPWGVIHDKEISMWGKTTNIYNIKGLSHLDYLKLDNKFSGKVRENRKLDTVANEDLGIRKLDYGEYKNLHELYRFDWQRFCEYNMRDVEILPKLENKNRLIETVCEIAYMAKVNYDDTLMNTRVWDSIIYTHLLKKKIVVPFKKKNKENNILAGGFVKPPKPGLYKWILSFDLNSLYPHLIMQYNISPETFLGKKDIDIELLLKRNTGQIEPLVERGYSVSGSGAYFLKDTKGFLPELMSGLYDKRVVYKNTMNSLFTKAQNSEEKEDLLAEAEKYSIRQKVIKVVLNSGYGALANAGFRFFQHELAESITLSGQLAIKWAERHINNYMNKKLKTENIDYILTVDTDSAYINAEGFANTFLTKYPNATDDEIADFLNDVSEKSIEPYIDKIYQKLHEQMNSYEQKMVMKRESITKAGLFIAKKRNALLVKDFEHVRYKELEVKITGLEIVRSSTPMWCRGKLKEFVTTILNFEKDKLSTDVKNAKNEFMKLGFSGVAQPSGVNGISKYHSSRNIYSKGTPIHVRGSLLYNHMIKKHGLENKYRLIQEGDKIKYVYLKLPNTLQEDVIACPEDELPEEFELDQYIDYKLQFEKTLMVPLNTMLEAANWDINKKSSFSGLI